MTVGNIELLKEYLESQAELIAVRAAEKALAKSEKRWEKALALHKMTCEGVKLAGTYRWLGRVMIAATIAVAIKWMFFGG